MAVILFVEHMECHFATFQQIWFVFRMVHDVGIQTFKYVFYPLSPPSHHPSHPCLVCHLFLREAPFVGRRLGSQWCQCSWEPCLQSSLQEVGNISFPLKSLTANDVYQLIHMYACQCTTVHVLVHVRKYHLTCSECPGNTHHSS